MNGKTMMRRVMQRVKKNKGRATLYDALEWTMWRDYDRLVDRPKKKKRRK